MNDTQALAILTRLLDQPGTLRIITNLPDPARPTHDPRDPAYNVQYAVTAIAELPDGRVAAHSAEGAYTTGKPADVLVRLLEWQHYDGQHPEQTRSRTVAWLQGLAP